MSREHSKSFYAHRRSNVMRTWWLLFFLFALVTGIGYAVSLYFEAPIILLGSAIFSSFTAVGSYWFADSMVLSSTGTKIIKRSDHKELYTVVDNLAIAQGIPTPRIGIIDDEALNAFATGRNVEKGVVVFTTGILKALDKKELEGVAAHEISHIVNRDVLVGTIAVVLTNVIAVAARYMHLGGTRNRNERGAMMVIALVFMVLAPILATAVRAGISRKREFLADTSGALLTRNPEGLASALEKIGGSAKPLDRASEGTAHLFIANPFGSLSKGVGNILATHPPIKERVARLRGADAYGDQK